MRSAVRSLPICSQYESLTAAPLSDRSPAGIIREHRVTDRLTASALNTVGTMCLIFSPMHNS
jgi:hypothetical protein